MITSLMIRSINKYFICLRLYLNITHINISFPKYYKKIVLNNIVTFDQTSKQ